MDKAVISIFWALLAVFVMLVLSFVAGFSLGYASGIAIMSLSVIFFVLGILLCIVAARSTEDIALKRLLFLAGMSAAGSMVSIVLHNIVFAVFKDFWESSGGGDEPFFFILGLIVFPIAFLVAVFGSITLMARSKK